MALYSTKGTISAMSDVASGVSQSGRGWQRMTISLEIPGYQGAVIKQVFSVTGDSVDDVMKYCIGDKVEVRWVMYAREWNGKWYNNVELISIHLQEGAAPAEAADPAPAPIGDGVQTDDLPF